MTAALFLLLLAAATILGAYLGVRGEQANQHINQLITDHYINEAAEDDP